MSIATEITRLQEAKADLKTAIESKGVTVPSNTKLDGYAALVDDIEQGGSGSVSENDVNFYDYDGTIVASYSAADFANLTAMPNNPDRTGEGLTAQGWNWSLSDAKSYVTTYGKLDVGQMYTPTDGKTKLYVSISDKIRPVYLYFSVSIDGGVIIDWGDGTTEQSSGTSLKKYTHNYAMSGDYIISFTVSSNATIGVSSDGLLKANDDNGNLNRAALWKVVIGPDYKWLDLYYIFRYCMNLKYVIISNDITSTSHSIFYQSQRIKCIIFPSGTTVIRDYICSGCSSLQHAILPNGVTSVGSNSFQNCTTLVSQPCIYGATNIGSSSFYNCPNLESFIIPDTITILEDNLITSDAGIKSITIPSSITRIKNAVFANCCRMAAVYCKATIPPTIDSNIFNGIADFAIYVPAESVEAYKTATNWSAHASYIQAIPE